MRRGLLALSAASILLATGACGTDVGNSYAHSPTPTASGNLGNLGGGAPFLPENSGGTSAPSQDESSTVVILEPGSKVHGDAPAGPCLSPRPDARIPDFLMMKATVRSDGFQAQGPSLVPGSPHSALHSGSFRLEDVRINPSDTLLPTSERFRIAGNVRLSGSRPCTEAAP